MGIKSSEIGGLDHLDKEFTVQELKELDAEGRAVLTKHKLKVRKHFTFALKKCIQKHNSSINYRTDLLW